ncbi:MAG: helix-turn-helix transcriptional regulator [Clostridia bacterium]|nr:helix-turn-helix transcriptional regulator [Clostridia bacterium]MBP3650200.1 helix-turn-helix transcriptional regulator [Clostridia bacterium]
MKTYCERLRELREKRGLKQSDVAQILETTQQVYSRYENGVNALPIHHLITLCKYYRISADYMLGLDGENPK